MRQGCTWPCSLPLHISVLEGCEFPCCFVSDCHVPSYILTYRMSLVVSQGQRGLLPAAVFGLWMLGGSDLATRVWMLPEER